MNSEKLIEPVLETTLVFYCGKCGLRTDGPSAASDASPGQYAPALGGPSGRSISEVVVDSSEAVSAQY